MFAADTPRLGFMYIVHRGIALYQAKIITKGKVWGQDMILSTSHLRSTAQARAMNYLEVLFISRRELLELAARYPSTAAKIRRAAILLALRREIILLAKVRIGAHPLEMISAVAKLAKHGKTVENGQIVNVERATGMEASVESKSGGLMGGLGGLAQASGDEAIALDDARVGNGGAAGSAGVTPEELSAAINQASSEQRKEIALLREQMNTRSAEMNTALSNLTSMLEAIANRQYLGGAIPATRKHHRSQHQKQHACPIKTTTDLTDPTASATIATPAPLATNASTATTEDKLQDGGREARRERPLAIIRRRKSRGVDSQQQQQQQQQHSPPPPACGVPPTSMAISEGRPPILSSPTRSAGLIRRLRSPINNLEA